MNTSTMLEGPELAERIRRLIEARGTTVAAVTRKGNLRDTFVKDILRGRTRSPRGDNLAKLASALDVTVDQLLDETAPLPGPAETARPSEAAPWSPSPKMLGAIRTLCPETEEPIVLQARISSPNFGIYAGDLLAIDTQRPAQPGEIVAVHVRSNGNGNDNTRIRRYLPPYLVSSEEGPAVEPELADGKVNTIMGPVVAVIRTKGR